VSAVNSFYSKIDLPANGLISSRVLHPVAKGALEEYKRRKARAVADCARGVPTPVVEVTVCNFIHACTVQAPGAMALNGLKVARTCVVQVAQFYLFDRPTSNLMLLRANLGIHGRVLHVTRSLVLGRKDKSARTVISR
jgi:hypothetical protein